MYPQRDNLFTPKWFIVVPHTPFRGKSGVHPSDKLEQYFF